MVVYPNMALVSWDQLTDNFDHTQLANNFAKLDAHDHTAGKGLQIPTAGIQDGAITADKIASGAIPDFTVADGSITTAKIANGAVTTPKIAAAPNVRVTNSSNQVITPTGGFGVISFNTNIVDSHGMHTAPGTSVTCVLGGVYLITTTVAIQPDINTPTPNQLKVRIVLNSGTTIAQEGLLIDPKPNYEYGLGTDAGVTGSTGWATINVATAYRLNTSDTIQVRIGSNSPTYNLTAKVVAGYSPTLGLTWLGA